MSRVVWLNPYAGNETFMDLKEPSKWFTSLDDNSKLFVWNNVKLMDILSIVEFDGVYTLSMKDDTIFNIAKRENNND